EWAGRRDDALNNWLPRRTGEALAAYRNAGFYPALDAPVLNQQGGAVPSGFQLGFGPQARGTIYFTLDGTDPRLPGGAVSPAARMFSSSGLIETLVPAGARWRWFTDPASDDGQTFGEFALSPGLLLQGENLVAVELHQATFNTSDASFDLELISVRPIPDSNTNSLPIISQNTLLKCRAKEGAEWS